MNGLHKIFGVAALATFAFGGTTTAQAADCGTAETVTIAEMTWLSAASLAHIAQHVLQAGYGCDAQLVPGDTVPTATSMLNRGQPNIAPELWVSSVQTIWDEAQTKGAFYKAGDIFASGGEEGWWVPDYVLTEHPELKTIEDLKANWKIFATADTPDKGRLYASPPGWSSEITGANLFKALGLAETFDLFSSGSGENLKAAIARAVSQHEAFVGYYWGPSDVIGKYHMVRLGMPESDPVKYACLVDSNCADPQVTGWAKGQIAVAVTPDIKATAPDVATFLSKMQVPNDKISEVLAWGDDNKATPEDVAVYFLKNYEPIWTTWVPADVADKIRASL